MILGAILAGGRSRRFGSDKAAAMLNGVALLDHVIARLRPQVDALVICGRDVAGMTCIADRPSSDLGPLGGLNAALRHGAIHGFATVISVPCDTPILPADLAGRLVPHAPAVAAAIPVIGAWPTALAGDLDAYLAMAVDRSMRHWASTCGAQPIELPVLDNVNSPADLARISRAKS